MPAPNILPSTVPIGTRFTLSADVFEFISIGAKDSLLSLFGPVIIYTGDVKILLTGLVYKSYNVYVHAIDWDSIPESVDNPDLDSCEEDKKDIKYCLWCNNKLGSNQNSPYCEIGKVYCKEYYNALEDRMAVDFRKPDEALESEKESVVRWVKNLLRIK